MSVRVRLTLLNVAVFAVVLFALGVTLRTLLVTTLKARVDEELLVRVEPMRAFWSTGSLLRKAREARRKAEESKLGDSQKRPEPPRSNELPEELRQRIRDLRDSTPIQYQPRVFRADGSELMRRDRSDTTPAVDVGQITTVGKQGKPLYVTRHNVRIYTVPLLDENNKIDAVGQTALSLDSTDREVGRLTREMLTLLPFALLLAAVGGLFLTDRALRPVRDVTAAAARIGEKDLSERLPVSGRDEFAHLATTFNGMLGRLDAAFDRQRRFVADASHELRTPLTVIKANTSLALADDTLSADYRDTLLEIDRAADRTNRIVQDLLLIARSDGGQLPIDRREVRLADILSEVTREARRLHPDGAKLLTEPVAADTVVFADPHLIHRLLLNLTDNALRHTPPTGEVVLSATATQLVVRDTGVGIAAEHLPFLTERFYRVDAARARKDGGFGLGLAISRAIAEAHDGHLEIESTLGQGTTVTVHLG